MDEVLKFNLVRDEVPVEITDEAGESRQYMLREMTGQDRDRFLTFVIQHTDGNGRLRDAKNHQAYLVSLCLFDPDNRNVSEATVAKWPARVQKALFMKCQRMNGLTDEAAAEKKD